MHQNQFYSNELSSAILISNSSNAQTLDSIMTCNAKWWPIWEWMMAKMCQQHSYIEIITAVFFTSAENAAWCGTIVCKPVWVMNLSVSKFGFNEKLWNYFLPWKDTKTIVTTHHLSHHQQLIALIVSDWSDNCLLIFHFTHPFWLVNFNATVIACENNIPVFYHCLQFMFTVSAC